MSWQHDSQHSLFPFLFPGIGPQPAVCRPHYQRLMGWETRLTRSRPRAYRQLAQPQAGKEMPPGGDATVARVISPLWAGRQALGSHAASLQDKGVNPCFRSCQLSPRQEPGPTPGERHCRRRGTCCVTSPTVRHQEGDLEALRTRAKKDVDSCPRPASSCPC